MTAGTSALDGSIDKTSLALTWDEMDALSSFLSENFGIAFLGGHSDIWQLVTERCGRRVADEYMALNDARAYGDARTQADATKRFYDLIAKNEGLLGVTHSQKWPFILDAAAYLSALAKAAGIADGSFLDIGCHAGYHALWLASSLGMSGAGMDLSKAAVRLARSKGKALGLTPERVTFDQGDFAQTKPAPATLVFSVDGGVWLKARSLERGKAAATDDGLVVWIGAAGGVTADDLRAALSDAGLELVLADVLGGWDGNQYGANTVLVLRPGADPGVPDDLFDQAEAIWNDGFKQYANTEGTPTNEKTISFFRTTATYGPRAS